MKKKLLLSAACAGLVTITCAATTIASSSDPRSLPEAPDSIKCAVYKGDRGIRHHKPSEVVGRQCETYYANDTAEDERESAELQRAALASRSASTVASAKP